jgi:hypothetical protein
MVQPSAASREQVEGLLLTTRQHHHTFAVSFIGGAPLFFKRPNTNAMLPM